MTEAYPLHWPAGYPRTPDFKKRSAEVFKVSLSQAVSELYDEAERMGGDDIILSTDLRPRLDGLPLAKQAQPKDSGAALYFKRKGKPVVIACDNYDKIVGNIRGIGLTLEAMRAIERHGSSDMLDRAFTGFEALEAPEQWWQVLDVDPNAPIDVVKKAWRQKAHEYHPDKGGSEADMHRINAAYEAAKRR